MGEDQNIQKFDMRSNSLFFDQERFILLCRARDSDNRKIWAKKLEGISFISNIIEDNSNYYISGESGDNAGQFIAVMKNTGSSIWFIPGKSFLHVIYKGFLYLIFVDEKMNYYLIKVDRKKGMSKWHHRVDEDLCEYSFSGKSIELNYKSGRKEIISSASGKIISN